MSVLPPRSKTSSISTKSFKLEVTRRVMASTEDAIALISSPVPFRLFDVASNLAADSSILYAASSRLIEA